MDIVERLSAVFALDSSAQLFEQDGLSWNYGQVEAFIEQLNGLLTQAGFEEGGKIGLLLRNRPACLAAALGVIWTKRCIVTVNPMLPPAPLRRDLENLAVPVLIADKQDWANPNFAEPAHTMGALGIALQQDAGGIHAEIVQPAGATSRTAAPAPGVAVEMLTSGTTGAPKRIKLELASLSRSLWTGSKYESGGGSVSLHSAPALLWMPLVHIGGLWNAMYQIYNGRRIILLERFDIDRWHDSIKTYKLRFATLPPSALGEVLARNFPKEDFVSLLAVRCGAAPLNHELAVAFEERYGVPVLEAYGATEFAGGVAGWTLKDYRVHGKIKRKSVGRANAGVELRIVDIDSFEPLPQDHVGLLEVRTAQVGDGTKWIRTTDLARLDADGFLYILGRADGAINRGGFKIMPEHVEAVLRKHPAVNEVCVVGVADERLGQVPMAAYELTPGVAAPGAAEFKTFLSSQLKPYEIPVRYMAMDKLPRTPSLKVSQVDVRSLLTQRG